MQNIVGEKGITALLEINTELTCPHPVKGLAAPVEAAELFIGMLELVLGQGADDFDQHHLGAGIELVELAHALLAEIDLEHKFYALKSF